MSHPLSPMSGFQAMPLIAPVLSTLTDIGYEIPTPIQQMTIPHLLANKDLLGQAQTGTGKTAAFALPLLSRIDLNQCRPQVLVLTPTRELAIQVAKAFENYGAGLKRLKVLAIYGGQEYGTQLKALKQGVHVVVGTPGRMMDHMNRRTLSLESLQCVVLDEADEMLRMGFIDDVEWILDKTPAHKQMALFSATLPQPVRRIAKKYLKNPEEITIENSKPTAQTIRQRVCTVKGFNKPEVLARLLESEPYEGVIVFVRTKTATLEIAEDLKARGFNAAALNGDIAQKQRELTVAQLKQGKVDILVATDVAARGLDVDRISHVINYDIPYDTESYIHRIGRTGRAGRSGQAVLFVSPKESHLLRAIERLTRQPIEKMQMPSIKAINEQRIARFKQRITETLANEDLSLYVDLIAQYQLDHEVSPLTIAAALAHQHQGNTPLLLKEDPKPKKSAREDRSERPERSPHKFEKRAKSRRPIAGMERYRIELGMTHGAQPKHIVAAISNDAGLHSRDIGTIQINDRFSFIDLPEGMPRELFRSLKRTTVYGRRLKISRLNG
ncbi:MAG: DEAD/DEAH box helicase [Phycisphaerae bacterium]|nr:DEAD/DEAH box helicase [Phycisphaerae bacterium]